MGLLERTRYLLSEGAAGLLELEVLRMDLEGWARDLRGERDQIDAERQAQETTILGLEKRVRTALQEEDERTARIQIAAKREAVAIRSALAARRGRLDARIEGLERDLDALRARIADLRRRKG